MSNVRRTQVSPWIASPVQGPIDKAKTTWSERHQSTGGPDANDAYAYTQRNVGRRLATGFRTLEGA